MNLSERVDVFLTGKEALVRDVLTVIKDKDIPLDDRWAMFDKAESLLPINTYYITIPQVEKNGYEWYDDFYCEKYETVRFVDILERVLDDPKRFKKIVIRDLMEEILATGHAGFRFDW